MKTFNTLIAVVALSTFSLPGLAATPAEHSHDHPPAKSAKEAAPSKAAKEALSGMDARIKDMQTMHEKMMAAKTPEERRAMMAEHMKSMRDGMAMMDKSGGGMGMKKDGGADGGMDMKKGGGTGMSHEMMGKRMDMMQQMMKMMMERTAAAEAAK